MGWTLGLPRRRRQRRSCDPNAPDHAKRIVTASIYVQITPSHHLGAGRITRTLLAKALGRGSVCVKPKPIRRQCKRPPPGYRLAGPQFSEGVAVFPVIGVEQRQAGAGHV